MEPIRPSKVAFSKRLSCYRRIFKYRKMFAGFIACIAGSYALSLPCMLSYASRFKLETYTLAELEWEKHAELPTEFRTVLFDVGIADDGEKPDLVVDYYKDDNSTLYIAKRNRCPKETHCLTGFYYKTLLTIDRKYMEKTWPGTDPPPDWFHPRMEPLAVSYAFFAKCGEAQYLLWSPSWGPRLLLLVECQSDKRLTGTPGIWLSGRGPSVNIDTVVPSK